MVFVSCCQRLWEFSGLWLQTLHTISFQSDQTTGLLSVCLLPNTTDLSRFIRTRRLYVPLCRLTCIILIHSSFKIPLFQIDFTYRRTPDLNRSSLRASLFAKIRRDSIDQRNLIQFQTLDEADDWWKEKTETSAVVSPSGP